MLRGRKEVKIVIYVALIFAVYQIFSYSNYLFANEHEQLIRRISIAKINSAKQSAAEMSEEDNDELISWENTAFFEYERRRKGPGEQGLPFELTDPSEIKENEEWQRKEGFYKIVSDKISVDRALPDFRPPK
jgi:hypothetical protein